MTWHWQGAVCFVLLALFLALAPSAFAQDGTFSSASGMTLPGDSSPSVISVSGMSGPLTTVSVTLKDVNASTNALDFLLVSPHGETVMLESDIALESAGTWTYADNAAGPQAGSATGTYLPTNNDNPGTDPDVFAGGPGGPFGSTMSALNGQDANGNWQLYVNDGANASVSLSGWTLQVTTAVAQVSLVPSTINFGSYTIGREAAPRQPVTVTNSGNTPLSLDNPDRGGPDATSFTAVGVPQCSPLAPGASCTIIVEFNATSAGSKSATMTFKGNAGNAQTLSLAGNALSPPPARVESGSPAIKIASAKFEQSGATTAGRATFLTVVASDAKEPVSGIMVNFGEALGIFGESGCVVGSDKGGSTTFRVPYRFLTPGTHTITLTVFAGGCGTTVSHMLTFAVVVRPAATAARRTALASDTLAGPDITSRCKNKDLLPSATNAAAIAKGLLCVINEQRKLYKLKALKVSKRLTQAALGHTQTMVVGHFFAHQGPKELGLAPRLRKARYAGAAGENIGAGAGSLGTPLAMVNGWMHSSLHRANLLSRKWGAVGIGVLPRFPLVTPARPVATFTTDFGPKP
ncbi:MAG: hypothetical protein QOC55_504 [Thermoleophilaceae bacterium]|jgi:uncharacterized protein YkwD|nr:hypothetical protein [Thermoleophilaceae bacterium]